VSIAGRLAGVRVLFVDDDLDTRDLVWTVLTYAGAEVAVAESGAAGLARLRAGRFDVLVADIGMPEEDGYVFLESVRQLRAEEGGGIPAAALTGYGRASDVEKVRAAGFQMHVVKPVRPDDLVSTIAHLAGRVPSAG
jgi:CheY-like chemotaxis protein